MFNTTTPFDIRTLFAFLFESILNYTTSHLLFFNFSPSICKFEESDMVAFSSYPAFYLLRSEV